MSSKKACKQCKTVYEGNSCPNCNSNESVTGFKGRLFVFDPENSEISKKVGIKKSGEYAIKVR